MISVPVSNLRVGDIIMAPERELRLWMRREAKARNMREDELELKITFICDGAPDKKGPWKIVEAEMISDKWYGPQDPRRWNIRFKARPTSLWPMRHPNPESGVA